MKPSHILLLVGLLIGNFMIPVPTNSNPSEIPIPEERAEMVNQNSLIARSSPFIREKSLGSRVITGYSSTVDQCDSTPFITASGQRVRTGIVASNEFPFGTMLKINGLPLNYEVQDRMNRRYKSGEIDIWFPTREEAIEFGKQVMEIIKLN